MAKTICIIDDSIDVVETTTAVLENEGYEVISAYNVEDGRALVKSKSPDLIILDVMFPESDSAGFELCRELRNDPSTKNIPLIMLTGVNEEFPLKFDIDAEWLPADCFLNKPIKPEALIEKIRAELG